MVEDYEAHAEILAMEIFNNREIAAILLMGSVLAYGIWVPAIRESLIDLAKSLFQRIFVTLLALFIIYIALVIWILNELDLWSVSQLKTTVIWTITIGVASIARTISNKDRGLLRRWIADNLRIIVVIEFVVGSYSGPLIVEIVVVSVLTISGIMLAVANTKSEYKRVAQLLNGILMLAGLGLIAFALYSLVSAFGDFATIKTLQDFYTPPLLSLLLLPFLLALLTYITYENAFLKLTTTIPDASLRMYAKRRAILVFRFNLESVRRWARNTAGARPVDKMSVDKGIREVVEAREREKNPPKVATEDGWPANEAMRYLDDYSLITGDYHPIVEDLWRASSSNLELCKNLIPDHIVYYVEGSALAVKRLRLSLTVNNPRESSASETRFNEIARSLIEKALQEDATGIANIVLRAGGGETSVDGGRTVSMWCDDWSHGDGGGFGKTLAISVDSELD